MICAAGEVTRDEIGVVESPRSKPFVYEMLNWGFCQVGLLPKRRLPFKVLNSIARREIVGFRKLRLESAHEIYLSDTIVKFTAVHLQVLEIDKRPYVKITVRKHRYVELPDALFRNACTLYGPVSEKIKISSYL
jgi:hypothetical protein